MGGQFLQCMFQKGFNNEDCCKHDPGMKPDKNHALQKPFYIIFARTESYLIQNNRESKYRKEKMVCFVKCSVKRWKENKKIE